MQLTGDVLAAEVSASSLLRYAGNVSASFRCCIPKRKLEKVTMLHSHLTATSDVTYFHFQIIAAFSTVLRLR